jgi:HAMP domain-containing protein
MADIDIVPKHRSRTWLWALLVIAVVLLIMWLMTSGGTAPRTAVRDEVPAGPASQAVVSTPPLLSA